MMPDTLTKLPAIGIIMILAASPVFANIEDELNQDDGTTGGEGPHIPEPMVFDLIRPLGTTRGELEINTLSMYAIGDDQLEWAPEIEYAIMDGLAVELEFPMQNAKLEEYKVAAQGTLGTHGDFIHGWQTIGRYLRHNAQSSEDQIHNADLETEGTSLSTGSQYSADLLYVAGYRFTQRWSTLNMLGIRGNHLGKHATWYGLANFNVFYTLDDNRALGIEVNNEFNNQHWSFAVTPQLHWNYTDDISLQFGPGISSSHASGTHWNLNCRLIYTF